VTSLVDVFSSPIALSRTIDVPDFNSGYLNNSVSIQRLPDEPIGTTTITLTNLVIGSAIQVETQAGALVENRTADTTTEVFTLNLFAPSSAENDLRIKVRKGSAEPFYRPYETLTTLTAAAQSIFVSQISD